MISKQKRKNKGEGMNHSFSPFCFFIYLLLSTMLFMSWSPATLVLEAASEGTSTSQSAVDSMPLQESGSSASSTSSVNLNRIYSPDAALGLIVPASFKEPAVAAQFAILMDAETGQILYKKNENSQAFPASITKIMTMLLAVENSSPDDIIIISHSAVDKIKSDEANIALQPGEQITMEQALNAVALASANDAANGVAEKIGGTLENFARMMTDRAEKIGALHTQFTNANGLQDVNHYTTAYDMALITREALKNDAFRAYFSRIDYTMPSNNLQPESRYFLTHHKMLYNTNYRYKYAFAGKTGYTSDAGSTLVTVAAKDGRELICVSLKESAVEAYADARTLFEYGFNQFEPVVLPISLYENSALDVIKNDQRIGTARFQNLQETAILVPKGCGCTLPMVRMNQTGLHFSDSTDIMDSSVADTLLEVGIPELITPFFGASMSIPLQAKVSLDPIATPTPVPGTTNSTEKGSLLTTILKYLAVILLLGLAAYIIYVVYMIFRTGYYKRWFKKTKKISKRKKNQLGVSSKTHPEKQKVKKMDLLK